MENSLLDWPRPLYQPGAHKPFLFYVIFGVDVSALNVSRSTHQCAGVPEGLSLHSYGPGSNPEVPDQFREGFLWDELRARSPELAEQVAAQTTCVIIRGEVEDDASLDYLRDTIGLIVAMLDSGGIAVFDSQRFQWWTASAWRDQVFGAEPADPYPHIVILTSPESDGRLWYHTRGMRKFGRPDLSMHGVTPTERNGATEMFNRFIRTQADGAIIPEGQRISMAGLPDNLYCRHRGHLDDPDFNNVHVEIEVE